MSLAEELLKNALNSRIKKAVSFNLPQTGRLVNVHASFVIDAKAIRGLENYETKVLHRIGGAFRATIRRLIKRRPKRKGARRNRSGKPPRYLMRGPRSLKDGIFYRIDERRHLVRIGASKFKTGTTSRQPSTPILLERGGPARTEVLKHVDGVLEFVKVKARYDPHPYFAPALPGGLKQTREILKQTRIDQGV